MATKSLVTYTGPKTFVAETVKELTGALARAFEAVDTAVRRLSDGASRRWIGLPTVRGNAAIIPNVALECDTVTSPTIVLTLPPPNPADYGLECGIVRLNGAGTITLFPIGGATLDGSTASQAIPATAGFYVLYVSPRGYWVRR